MKARKTNSEHGQAMVLLVLVIVGLLGALAVAVDGGMIMYDRRSAQNAADAGALAQVMSWLTIPGIQQRFQPEFKQQALPVPQTTDTAPRIKLSL